MQKEIAKCKHIFFSSSSLVEFLTKEDEEKNGWAEWCLLQNWKPSLYDKQSPRFQTLGLTYIYKIKENETLITPPICLRTSTYKFRENVREMGGGKEDQNSAA